MRVIPPTALHKGSKFNSCSLVWNAAEIFFDDKINIYTKSTDPITAVHAYGLRAAEKSVYVRDCGLLMMYTFKHIRCDNFVVPHDVHIHPSSADFHHIILSYTVCDSWFYTLKGKSHSLLLDHYTISYLWHVHSIDRPGKVMLQPHNAFSMYLSKQLLLFD